MKKDNVNIQDLIDEADSNTIIQLEVWSDFWFSLSKMRNLDPSTQQRLEWENKLFSFALSVNSLLDHKFQKVEVNDSIIDYFSERLNQTLNPVFKVKYCDFIIQFKMNFRTIEENLQHYYQLVEYCFQGENYHINEIGAEILGRCLELSTKLFIGKKNEEKLQLAVNTHFDILKRVERFETRSIVSLALVNSLFSLKSGLWKYTKPLKLLSILEENIKQLEGEFSRYSDGFWVLLIEFYNRQGDSETKLETMIKNAQRREKYYQQLKKEGSSNLYLASAANDIYNMFNQIPKDKPVVNESLDKYSNLIRYHYKKAQQKEFASIKDDLTLPADPFKQYIEDYYFDKPIDVQLRQMLTDPDFFPDYTYTLKVCKENNPIISMFSTTYLDEDGAVKHQTDNEDDFATNRAKLMFLNFLQLNITALIKPIFDRISTNNDLLVSLDQFFERNSIITKSRYKLIRFGFERYINNDHISSIHILVFQIEGILRDMLGMIGKPTFKIDNDGIHYQIIAHDILPKLQELENFDENLKIAFEVVLFHPYFNKIRHLIAHGLFPFDKYSKELNICLIFLLIRLNAMDYYTKM